MTEAGQTEHSYGWKPSLPDARNRVADITSLTINATVDPRQSIPVPLDQLRLGSCTSNTVARAKRINDIVDGKDTGDPSRLFIYFEERLREGTVGYDSGAYGHDGFKCLRAQGAPPETLWPYDISTFTERPSEEAYLEAKLHRIKEYRHPAPTINAFKAVLSNRQTIAFGFTVYSSFESLTVERTGKVPMPLLNESVLGGHEMLVVGYLEQYPEYALVENSWGPDWGLGGYCLFPWAYLLDYRYASDFRTIYRPAGG